MKDGMKNGYSKIHVRCKHLSSMIMGDVESDEHLRIFKCLIDTGSHVLRNAIGIKVLNNNSISFIQYLENNKHQFYHQFEKKIWRKCCLGSPHGCVFPGTMDKKIFNKMYNKTAEHNTQDCLDRFETNAGISPDGLDLSDLNFFLWNSSSLSAQEEHSLKKIMSIRSAICHPSSSHSYTIDELETYWSDLKSAVLLFAEPKCYKDIVEMQVETLQNCKLNVIESAKVIEKMKIESNKILHAIKQATPLKIVDIETLIKDGTCGLENCVMSENNKTKSYINDTFREFKENIEKHHEVLSTKCKEEIQSTVTQESGITRLHSEDQSRAIDSKLTESEQRVCQTVIQSQGRLEDKLIEQQNKTRNHTVELKADLMEENRFLKAEVMDVKTEIKQLKTILIGYIGKQKVDLAMNTEQIEKSTESSDNEKVDMTLKVNQTQVTEEKENEIIENLPPEVEIQTNNDSLPESAVTETIQITGKKVNSIILELKATPGILHSVETFKAAILTLVQVMQTAGGINVEIEDSITVHLKFESPLTEDQFAVVKCLFTKEWNTDNDTKQLPGEYSSISDEYSSTENVEGIMFRPELDTYSQKETSEVFQLETTKPITKRFCQLCDNKDKRIKALEEQNEKHGIIIKRNMLDLQAEKRKLEDLQAKHKGLLNRTRPVDTGMISMSEKLGTIQKELKSSNLSGFGLEHTYDFSDFAQEFNNKVLQEQNKKPERVIKRNVLELQAEKGKLEDLHAEKRKLEDLQAKHKDSSCEKTLYECSHCYEMEVIIIQLDRRLCEIRRRIIEAKGQSFFMYYIRVNKAFEDLLKITDQSTSITSIEEKGRMKDKELKSDRSSQDSKLISDVDVRDPETKANQTLMESQASQGRRPELDQTEEKSDLSLRISEIRREYASSYYTKTDKQKGLGIIVQGERSRYVPYDIDCYTTHLQEFFEEKGFIVKCTESGHSKLLKYMTDGQFYCVFIVLLGHHGIGLYEHDKYKYLIRYLLSLSSRGKPMFVIADSTFDSDIMRNITEDKETLIVNSLRGYQETIPFLGLHRNAGKRNIFDDFMTVTRSNRFADIMDILTKMNGMHDHPILTFQSSLRKKFCFL